MTDESIDRLQIEIEGSAEGAFENLRKLKTELRAIKKISDDSGLTNVYNELKNIASLDFSNLHELASISSNLSTVKSALGGVSDEAKEVKDTLASIQMPELTSGGSPINDLSDDIRRTSDEIQDSLNDVSDTFEDVSNRALTNVEGASNDAGNAVENASRRVQDTANQSTANILAFIQNILTQINIGTINIQQRAQSTGREIRRQTRDVSREVKKSTSEATSHFSKLFSSIKRIVLYRAIRAAIKSVVSAFKTGIDDIYQYSKHFGLEFSETMDSLATEALYFKNSLGAVVAPLVNAVAPAISFVSDKLVDLNNNIAMTIAMLRGQSTYTKAIKYNTEYAEAAGDASKKAKELKNSLASFDEIHIIGQNDTSSGSKSDNLDYSKMFEEAEVGGGKLFGVLEKIKVKFDEIENKLKTIRDNIKSAFDFELSGERIISSVERIAQTIYKTFVHIFGSTLDMLANADFSGLINSFAGLLESLEPVISAICGIFIKLYDNVLLPIAKWAIEAGLPAFIDVLSSALGVLAAVLGAVSRALDILMPVLQPIIEFVEETVVEILGDISDLLDIIASAINENGDNLDGLFSDISELITSIWKLVEPALKLAREIISGTLKFIGELFSGTFGDIIEIVRGVIEVLDGIMSGDWSKVWEGFKKIFEGTWKSIIDTAVVKWKAIWAIIKGAWDWFWNWLTGLKEKAEKIGTWIVKTAKEIYEDGLWGTIKKAINSILGGVEGMANGVVKAVNKVTSAMNALSFDVPDWVPGIGGKTFGFDIKPLAEISIPRLKNGGFPDGENGLFYANSTEIIGKFSNGKTAVANNDQIVAGISNGVYAANAEQSDLLREQNKLLRQLLEKESGINVSTITKAQERMNRKHGKTIVPVGT